VKPRQLHIMTERRSPTHVMVMCSCGWKREISRRQNALARNAKVRAAEREHEQFVRLSCTTD